METIITETLKELAKQVPALLLQAGIVYFFLKFGATLYTKFSELFRDIHKEHLDERGQCRQVIKENTESYERLTVSIDSLKHELQNLHRSFKR